MTTRSRRKFTPEFKAEAVELVNAADGNIAPVAKEWGIYDSMLGNWVRQARAEAAGGPSAEERAEILGITLISRDAVSRELEQGDLEEWVVPGGPRERSWPVVGRTGDELPPTARLFLGPLTDQGIDGSIDRFELVHDGADFRLR